MLLPICITIIDSAYLDQILTTQLGLERISNNGDGNTVEKGTLNQRSFVGLPRAWQLDDTKIECNITATAMQEAVLIDGIQARLHNDEFEDIDKEEWAQIVAQSGVCT
jgi:hypothetical protein